GATYEQAMAKVMGAVAAIAATETAEVLAGEGVTVIEGRAGFTSSNEVSVGGRRVGADRFVVATGARPSLPPVPGLADVGALTSDDIWDLKIAPGSLIVLGGGAIGCEMAQALARLGVSVTIIEAEGEVLPNEEPEASEAARAALVESGVTVLTATRAAGLRRTAGGIEVELDTGRPVAAEQILVAIGRRPVTDGLDLDAAGVEVDDAGRVIVDDYLATSTPHIYSVGDVTGRLQLTHAADEMARLAVGNAFSSFRRRRFRPSLVPWVTFLSPEVARVGMTEAQAAATDPSARVAHLPMSAVDRAVVEGRTDGFIKVICGRRAMLGNIAGGRVLGATIVAERAGEMIQELALARRSGMFPARIALATHAYPTWSLGVQQAVGQFFAEVNGRSARKARAA
ncbi:MAG: dihydrolipoyl dehydrogenase family protein, partial [Acidimicrobiales bacterium]